MVVATRTIEIEPGSDIAKVILEATETPTVLIVDGIRFRVEREDDSIDAHGRRRWSGYDPQRAIDGMRAAAGSWRDLDTERMKADLRRWREEGSREPVNP